MKRLKFIFLAVFILCLASCEKEKIVDQPIQEIVNRNSNNDVFFDLLHTSSILNIQTNQRGTYPFIDEVIIDLQNRNGLTSLKNESLYPCWNCAEPEYFGFHNYYIPVYDIGNGDLHGLLIAQEKKGGKKYYYLSKSLVILIVSARSEPYSNYWNGIMAYFDLNSYPDNRVDYFMSLTFPCLWFDGVCGCAGATPGTYSYCHMLDPINNPDCDTGTCPTGSGGGGGSGVEEDLPFFDIADWSGEDNDEGGSGQGSGNGSGNNSSTNTNTDTSEPWDDFCGGFNGSLGTANNTDLNLDGSTGITIFENPTDLYLIQLEGFINQYGLQSQFKSQELMEIIGEECAVSNVTEVKKCLKCHLINELGLSENQNYELIDNFDVVADCAGDPNCVECVLNVNDKITTSFLEECPLLECIFNDLIESPNDQNGNSTLLCEIFSSFLSNPNLDLTITFDHDKNSNYFGGEDNYKSIEENPASTVPRNNTFDDIIIIFHGDLCNDAKYSDPMQAAATFFHELIHAEFYSWILEKYPDGGYLITSENGDAWKNILETNFPEYIGASNQHNVMNYFIEEIQNSLHALNGYEGNAEDYLYWALLVTNANTFFPDNYSEVMMNNLKTEFNDKITNINIGC